MWAWMGGCPACLVPSWAGLPSLALDLTESKGNAADRGGAQGQLQGRRFLVGIVALGQQRGFTVGLQFQPDPLHAEQRGRCFSWPQLNRLSSLRAACVALCTPGEGSGGCCKDTRQTIQGAPVFWAEGILWGQKG